MCSLEFRTLSRMMDTFQWCHTMEPHKPHSVSTPQAVAASSNAAYKLRRAGEKEMALGRPLVALRHFAAALDLQRDSSSLACMASTHLALKDFSEALDFAQQALSFDETLPRALVTLAHALEGLEDYEQAGEVCVRALHKKASLDTETVSRLQQMRERCARHHQLQERKLAAEMSKVSRLGVTHMGGLEAYSKSSAVGRLIHKALQRMHRTSSGGAAIDPTLLFLLLEPSGSLLETLDFRSSSMPDSEIIAAIQDMIRRNDEFADIHLLAEHLEHVAQAYINKLTDHQAKRELLLQCFKAADKNGNGELEPNELLVQRAHNLFAEEFARQHQQQRRVAVEHAAEVDTEYIASKLAQTVSYADFHMKHRNTSKSKLASLPVSKRGAAMKESAALARSVSKRSVAWRSFVGTSYTTFAKLDKSGEGKVDLQEFLRYFAGRYLYADMSYDNLSRMMKTMGLWV